MFIGGRTIALCLSILASLICTGCFSIRTVLSAITASTNSNTSYTVITSKNDGCTNNTFRKETWATGLELLCQTSQTVGIKSVVAYSNVLLPDSSGNNNLCWIALADQANAGKKVFCQLNGNIVRLNTETLDIPEQKMKTSGTNLYFFGRKPASKFVLYRWDQTKITEITGNYNGAGSW